MLLVLIASLAVALPQLLIARPAYALTVTAATAGTKIVSQGTSVWGTAQGAPNRPVRVEVLVGARWAVSQTGTTSATGSYVLPLTYGANTVGTYTYRVGATLATGTIVYSPSVTLRRVNPTITAATTGTKIVGLATNIWGNSGLASRPVVVQASVGGGWATINTGRTTMSGSYAVPLSYGVTTVGVFAFRAGVLLPNGTTVYSPVVHLQRVNPVVTAATAGRKPVGEATNIWGNAGLGSRPVAAQAWVGRWATISTGTSAASGAYTLPLSYGVNSIGTHRFRVGVRLHSGAWVWSGAVTLQRLPNQGLVSAGDGHTCAVTSAGGVKCWGRGWSGQLGGGSALYSSAPINVVGLAGVRAVAAGNDHTCALTLAGAVKCWGRNADGQLGDGTTTSRDTPVNVRGLASGVRAISAGNAFTCAVTSAGAVRCWGSNGDGRLGDGTTTDRRTPTAVRGLTSGVVNVTAGEYHACAVTAGGRAFCWGRNSSGELGNGSNTDSYTPVAVANLGGVVDISAGWLHTCAATSSGGAFCWGDNLWDQLGTGTNIYDSNTPVAVAGLSTGVVAVEVGWTQSCALLASGARCWGRNRDGQLGDGSATDRPTPVGVRGLSGVRAISTGYAHTCARTATGVACWGYNGIGQLGDGTTTNRSFPVTARGVN